MNIPPEVAGGVTRTPVGGWALPTLSMKCMRIAICLSAGCWTMPFGYH